MERFLYIWEVKTNKLYIAICLAALAFIALLGAQYFMVSNTYHLKNKEFKYTYNKDLFNQYSSSINNGVLYKDAYKLIDSLVVQFKGEWENTDEGKRETINNEYFEQMVIQIRQHNPLDEWMQKFQVQNELDSKLEYVILLHQFGVLLNDTTEWVMYKETVENEFLLLGSLQHYNNDNYIMRSRTAVKNNYRMVYSLYVDTPSRKWFLFKGLWSAFALSLLTILSMLGVLLFTIYHWQQQKKLSDIKSDFINNISHELKTPLATINVANKSLQKDQIADNKSQRQHLLQIIHRQSQRLQQLINQVLDISIKEQEAWKLEREHLSLNHFLEQVVADFQLKEATIPIVLNLQATNDQVLIAPFHFTTVINNLLDNAVKYNPNKELIRVETFDKNNQQIGIRIIDEGIGMSMTTKGLIFDKFYRAAKGDVHNVKGLGLGLYYVKQVVEAHNGTIEVESEIGKGSCFEIILPLERSQV